MHRIQGNSVTGRSLAACGLMLVATAAGLTAQASGGTAKPTAHAARRLSLVETAHLKFSSEHGAALNERGSATGTYNAPVVTIYPRGGSIRGTANANYVVRGVYGYFGGTFTLRGGTGKYSHISEVNGKPLGISGKIERTNFAMEVKAHGEANL
jgi:hypothetical protein